MAVLWYLGGTSRREVIGDADQKQVVEVEPDDWVQVTEFTFRYLTAQEPGQWEVVEGLPPTPPELPAHELPEGTVRLVGANRWQGHVVTHYTQQVVIAAPGERLTLPRSVATWLVTNHEDEWVPDGWEPDPGEAAIVRVYKAPKPRPVGVPLVNIKYAWIQYVGSNPQFLLDVYTATLMQHIDAQPNQVMFLPFETCAFLLAHYPTAWTAGMWLLPDPAVSNLTAILDVGTGLYYIPSTAANPWGMSGVVQPYFEPDSRLGNSDEARLMIVAGLPVTTK